MTVFADEPFRAGARLALASVTDESPRSSTPLGQGNRKRTALVRFRTHDPVVIQLCERRNWLRTEARLLVAIHDRTDVPVPPVLASGVTEDVAYLVTGYVAGDDLHEQFCSLDGEKRETLARRFGRHLGRLHEQFRFDGYGPLVVEDGRLRARREGWAGWLREYAQGALERLPPAFDSVREPLTALVAAATLADSPPARLFPWDFRPGNALVADGRLAAVVDWEAPLAAPPALSAAKAEYLVVDWYATDPAPLRAAFVAGYEQVRPYPDVEPVHRTAAIADSAVDSTGVVTNPGYPELDREAAIEFHREALAALS